MKRCQQWLSAYLVLCLVFASAAGLSPLLHFWLDHGGEGAAHTHRAGGEVAAVHVHPHPRPHDLPPQGFVRAESFSRPQLTTERPLKLFGLEPTDIYRAVGRLVARVFADGAAAPEEPTSQHTHHTLSQLLLSGAVEGAVVIFAPVVAPMEFTCVSSFPENVFVASDWNAQTASRGPPLLFSLG